jgi:hypothetical protein
MPQKFSKPLKHAHDLLTSMLHEQVLAPPSLLDAPPVITQNEGDEKNKPKMHAS